MEEEEESGRVSGHVWWRRSKDVLRLAATGQGITSVQAKECTVVPGLANPPNLPT